MDFSVAIADRLLVAFTLGGVFMTVQSQQGVGSAQAAVARDGKARLAIGLMLLAAFAARMAIAILMPSIQWPDEIYQVLERAHLQVFGFGVVSWDWGAGLRSVVPPAVFMPPMYLAKLLGLGPDFYMPAVAAVMSALSLIIVWVAYRAGENWRLGLVGAAPAAFWAEMLLYAPHPLMDVMAAPFLVLGTYWLIARKGVAAGLVLALAICLRPALALPVLVAAIMVLGLDRRGWAALLMGSLITALCYGMADLFAGGTPFGSLGRYVIQGLGMVGAGVGELFFAAPPDNPAITGTTAWNQLISQLIYNWGTALPFLMLLLGLGARRNGVWLAMAAVIFIEYSLVPNREYRFVYPALACLMIPLGAGLRRAVMLVQQQSWFAPDAVARIGILLMAVCSLTAARMPSMEKQWSRGAAGLEVFAELRRDTAVCGIAFTPDMSLAYFGGHTVLHRNVPLYDKVRIDTSDASGYSDILSGAPVRSLPSGYADMGCRTAHFGWAGVSSRICHYRRSGGCGGPD